MWCGVGRALLVGVGIGLVVWCGVVWAGYYLWVVGIDVDVVVVGWRGIVAVKPYLMPTPPGSCVAKTGTVYK